MKNFTYELLLKVPDGHHGEAEILRNLLLQLDIPPHLIVEKYENGYLSLSVFGGSKSRAELCKKRFESLSLKKVLVKINILQREDWQDKWKRDFRPFSLTDGFEIVPTWLKKKHKNKKYQPIYIDTSLAFGTGLHESTRLLARLIEHQKGKYQNFLDVGTGTGILAILARRCGATTGTAIDVSQEAIKVARINIAENGLTAINLKRCDAALFKSKTQYDLVAANLNSFDLLKLRSRIISFVGKGKYLAVSGISREQATVFKKGFSRNPLRCIRAEKGKEWVAFLYKKS